MDLRWYLIHTKPRQEQVALINLERQGYECYLPAIQVRRVRRRKLEIVTEALFARYLFIRLDRSGSGLSWSPIRSTLGVSRLVKFGETPLPVDDALIELLRNREAAQQVSALFDPGDIVIITEGPFAGLEAIYRTQDAEQRATILLQILNRPVNIKLDLTQLRKK